MKTPAFLFFILLLLPCLLFAQEDLPQELIQNRVKMMKERVDKVVFAGTNQDILQRSVSGGLIRHAIANCELFLLYHPKIEKVLDLDKRKQNLLLLDDLVSRFEKMPTLSRDTIETAIKGIFDLANLETSNHRFITSNPVIYIPTDTTLDAVFLITGFFPDGAFEEVKPVLVNGDYNLEASTITREKIEFRIPAEIISKVPQARSTVVLPMDLALPFPVMKKKKVVQVHQAYFRTYLIMLPRFPGSLNYTTEWVETKETLQRKSTKTYIHHSSNRDLVDTYCHPYHHGYEVVESSVKMDIEWSEGRENSEWFVNRQKKDGKTCFTVETIYNRSGVSGKLNFKILYDIRKVEEESAQSEGNLDLEWGETYEIDLGKGTFEIQYRDFKGSTHLLKEPLPEQFGILSFQKTGQTLKISVAKDDDLFDLSRY